MKSEKLSFRRSFHIGIGNKRAQVAEMVLKANDKEGGPDNKHTGSDQWLYVQSGRGVAIIKNKKVSLKKGVILLIERGQTHEIRNLSPSPLKTLNIYIPPAYRSDGNPLPKGK